MLSLKAKKKQKKYWPSFKMRVLWDFGYCIQENMKIFAPVLFSPVLPFLPVGEFKTGQFQMS